MNSQPRPESLPHKKFPHTKLPKLNAPYSVKPLWLQILKRFAQANVQASASAVAAANYRSEQYSPHPAPANSASNSWPLLNRGTYRRLMQLNLESADSIVPASATVSESLQFEMPVSTRPATSPMMHYSLPQDAAHAVPLANVDG